MGGFLIQLRGGAQKENQGFDAAAFLKKAILECAAEMAAFSYLRGSANVAFVEYRAFRGGVQGGNAFRVGVKERSFSAEVARFSISSGRKELLVHPPQNASGMTKGFDVCVPVALALGGTNCHVGKAVKPGELRACADGKSGATSVGAAEAAPRFWGVSAEDLYLSCEPNPSIAQEVLLSGLEASAWDAAGRERWISTLVEQGWCWDNGELRGHWRAGVC